MEDRFQTLINHINILKENQNTKEKEIEKIRNIFETNKAKLQQSNDKIIAIVGELKSEIAKAEENKKSMIDIVLSNKSEEDRSKLKPELTLKQQQMNQMPNIGDSTLPYKKFLLRKSILTILLQKPTYQAIYNVTFSYLILYTVIFFFNLYLGKSSIIFQDANEKFYPTGIAHFVFYVLIKLLLLLSLVIITNIPGPIGLYIVPGLVLGILVLIFGNNNLFDTTKFSSVIRILHYWDNVTFILKIFAYYFEKRLLISYRVYQKAYSFQTNIEKRKVIIIQDFGDDKEIVFDFKELNLMKEIKNFFLFYCLPTLIYRDIYPTEQRNSSKMLRSLINCVLCIGLIFFGLEVHLIPMFSNPKDFISAEKVSSMIISFILYSLCGLFVIVFSFLHSFSNFTSEMFSCGDKYFYGDFFNSTTPKGVIKKLAYVYEEYFKFYLVPLFLMFFPKIETKFYKKYLKDVMTMIFLSIIFDYIVFSFIHTQSPIISISLFGCLVCSYPLDYMTNDNVYLINWLILSLGIGITALSITSERVIIQNNIIDFNDLSLFNRIMPKICYLLLHPDKLLLNKSIAI